MAQQRQIDTIVQRADHYETATGRELRYRAAARVHALRNRDVAPTEERSPTVVETVMR